MGAETEMRATHALGFGTSGAEKPSLRAGLQHSECMNNSEFPAGLRILVVDDDPICLLILDRMLCQCLYKVTTCERAIEALQLLRENKDGFDLVISDVHMPDMDGFKLLELVGLEMDLPVIMMSANGETSAVMKGIKHGACDYLLKPVRIEELKNIWQHVVRRKRRAPDVLDSYEERHRHDETSDFHASDGFEGTLKPSKKRKDAKEEEEETELENDDPATSKKPRVVWSVELHQKFVTAVNQLGLDKAVPKRILELMDVRGLTRENVASHLQKYRLYLKRLSGVAHQAGGLGAAALMGVSDATFGGSRGGMLDLQAQAFVSALQAGLYDRMSPAVVAADPFSPRQLGTHHGINNDVGARSSYVAPPVNRSIASSALDFKHLGQGLGHFTPFGQGDKGLTGFSALHELSGASGMGAMGQGGALDSTFPSGTASNPLMMQPLQHQAHHQASLPNATSMGGQLGGDLGPKLNSFDATSHLRLGQEKPSLSSPRFTPSTGPSSWKGHAVDTRSYTNPLTAITSISPGSEAGITLVTKELAARPGQFLSSNIAQGGSYNPLTLASRSVSNARPNTWQGWQGFEAIPSARQGVGGGAILNSEYHRGLTDQAEEKGIGWVAGLQDSAGLESNGLYKPLYTAIPSYGGGEQCTGAEGDYKSKESGGPDLLLGSKVENAIILDAVPSEDLLTSYFKHS